ncbi:MAG: class B sortase [Ruminococcus sp.]
MNASKFFLKTANFLISGALVLFLIIAGAYSAYSLWDNAQVYASVDDVQAELLKLKPEAAEEGGATFDELRAINPDVCAWLTLDNTEIDYPVLQGEDNLTYINKDVYGNFSLSGSVFLDSGCDNTFSGKYSLLYGHHMANSKMFGDLDLYEEEKFFNENTTGMLILPDRSYELEIFACLRVSASEENIFTPQRWQTDTGGLLEFVKNNGMYIHQDKMDRIGDSENYSQILAMSTCSSEFTDARTVLLAVMKPYSPET